MFRLAERRTNVTQRRAVDRLLARAAGRTSILRVGGNVFVYDEQRNGRPPVTVRFHVSRLGSVSTPHVLTFD